MTLPGKLPIKKNPIGSAFSEILWYRQTKIQFNLLLKKDAVRIGAKNGDNF